MVVDNEKVELKQIEASAKFGKLMSKQAFALFVSMLGLFVAVDIGFVVEAFFPYEQSDLKQTIAIAGFLAFVTTVPTVFVIRELVHRAKIKRWIQDAVIVKAHVAVIEHTSSLMFASSTSKVAVDFCYNKESLSFTSGKFAQLDGYVGARVKVAFSPKYQQVMFLANSNEIK